MHITLIGQSTSTVCNLQAEVDIWMLK